VNTVGVTIGAIAGDARRTSPLIVAAIANAAVVCPDGNETYGPLSS